jgi:two-component system LytT family response regulator
MAKIIKTVIIDDEPGNIVTLTALLNLYCPQVMVEATAPDIVKGAAIIEAVKPELVFLDIEMPYGNGFDLLDQLSPVSFEVVFITAFNNYAVKAFKYAALDYILKPVNITELKEAVLKVSKRLEEKKINTRVASLLNNLKSANGNSQKIGLPVEDGLYFEDVANILYMEASGSYTAVYTKNKKKQLVSKNLKEFEDILSDTIFCRVHHSYIININCIKKYYKGRGGYVEMEDGTNIAIAVRKKDAFLEKFSP